MKVNTTTQYAELIGVLGSTVCLEILLLLIAAHPRGMLVRELQTKLNLPRSTIDRHIDKLRQREWLLTQPAPEGTEYHLQVATLEQLLAFVYVECCDRQSIFAWETIPEKTSRYVAESLLPRQPERLSLESLIDQAIYERLSGKAMQVLLLAHSENLRLGRNFIGAEEMLLGLMAEGSGLAAIALSTWGLELEHARQVIQAHLGPSRQTRKDVQFDTRARLVLSLSLDEATASGHPLVNTEHILLGLIREWQLSQQQNRRLGAVADLLASLERSPEAMIEQLLIQDPSA
ncbi:MAG: hypothetical protein HC910_15490 [Spirulinaceae cyanobacterium SM2_1_0]|nr:hypothetical protein [Spirulinaceae cyanobacterium SM2_1_0]